MTHHFFQTYEPGPEPVFDDAAANFVERGDQRKGVADCDVFSVGLAVVRNAPANEVAIYQALKQAGITMEQAKQRLPSILGTLGGKYQALAINLQPTDHH